MSNYENKINKLNDKNKQLEEDYEIITNSLFAPSGAGVLAFLDDVISKTDSMKNILNIIDGEIHNIFDGEKIEECSYQIDKVNKLSLIRDDLRKFSNIIKNKIDDNEDKIISLKRDAERME